jgi:hypothetical protein
MSRSQWLCAASALALAATLPPAVQAACPTLPDPNITFSGDTVCVPATGTSGDLLNAGASAPAAAGSVSITGGATVTLQPGAGAAATPIVQIGREPGSVGGLTVSGAGSALEVNGGGKTGNAAQVRIGVAGGTGSATIASGGALRVLDPTAPTGSAGPAGDSISVGLVGGTGSLTVNSGTVTVDSGSGAFLRVGDRGGTGTLTVSNGSTITVRDRDPATTGDANVSIGRDLVASPAPTATTGTATISGSTVSIQSDGGFAGLLVGREANTTGTASVSGSTLSITAGREAGLQVGRDTGATGTLTLSNSTASVQSSLGDAYVVAGRGGTGAITVQGAATSLQIGAAQFADIIVGRNAGSNGTMVIRDGAAVTVTHSTASGFATGTVGRLAGSTGTLSVRSGATLDLTGPNAVLQAGREAGSFGSILVDSGGVVALSGTTESTLMLGRLAGASGNLAVASGGQVTLSGPLARVLVGAPIEAGGTLAQNLAAGAGTLTISGAGSLVSADRVIVGAPVSLAGSTSDGGTVIVSNGGTLQAGEVRIGTSGLVGGSGGTIIGSVILDGGTLAPGLSPGTLNIVGDLTVLDGILKIEIGGAGAGQYDVLNVSGTTMIAGGTVLFEFIDGFAPTAGQTFDFFSGPNAPIIADDVTYAVGGLQAGFQFDLGPSFTFVALTDGVSTTAVPEPASAALLLAGLLGLATLRRRAA